MLGRKIKNEKNSSSTSIEGTPLDYQIPDLSYHKSNTFPRGSATLEGPLTPVSSLPSSSLTSTGSYRPPPLSLHNKREVRPSASKASLSGRDARPRSPGLTPSSRPSPLGIFPPTPTLPPKWSSVHDRAICVLDACDYSLDATVKKMRSAFPELAGSVLTPIMIDKRLRTLDQNVDLDFFRIGLDHLLLPGNGDDDQKTKLSKAESKQATSVESHHTTPSMPSFSSVSTDRQNSDISVGRHDQVLVRPFALTTDLC